MGKPLTKEQNQVLDTIPTRQLLALAYARDVLKHGQWAPSEIGSDKYQCVVRSPNSIITSGDIVDMIREIADKKPSAFVSAGGTFVEMTSDIMRTAQSRLENTHDVNVSRGELVR